MNTKLQGFIGPAYTLDSTNVDAQRCVNLYPEVIESGNGKEGQQVYLKSTPGLASVITVGDGPIRMVHRDSIGRIFVASGGKLYTVAYNATTGVWSSTLCGAGGEAGGAAFAFRTSTGKVKAASMSFIGEGTDSSTIFVDGTQNYLYLDGSPDTLTELADGEKGQATLAVGTYTDIKIDVLEDYADYIGYVIRPTAGEIDLSGEGLGDDNIYIDFRGNGGTLAASGYIVLSVTKNPGSSLDLSTEELVEWINTGAVASRTDVKLRNSDINYPSLPPELIYTLIPTYYVVPQAASASGGSASDSVFDAFPTTTDPAFYGTYGTTGTSGAGYGSVPEAKHVVWVDGYFVVPKSGTNKFFVSDLQSFNIDNLSFASSEGDPDLLLTPMVNQRNLYLFNEKSTEIYYNTGNADFPFERIQGGFIEVGCAAQYSVAKIDNTIFWLGQTNNGRGIVYATSGVNFQRVSTFAIEQAIGGYADMSSASAYTYQDKGHKFYVLNFSEASWVYDVSTGLWHERAYLSTAGTLDRHLNEFHAYDPTSGFHIVASHMSTSNKIYIMKDDVYTDAGDEILRMRTSPHISSGYKRVKCNKFQLDIETGVGLVTGQGVDPQVMLDWSDDGGHTWSNEIWKSFGAIGKYAKRVIWNRLGAFRERIFRVKITDPVPVTIINAQLDAEELGN